jgi:hypothetical protein
MKHSPRYTENDPSNYVSVLLYESLAYGHMQISWIMENASGPANDDDTTDLALIKDSFQPMKELQTTRNPVRNSRKPTVHFDTPSL